MFNKSILNKLKAEGGKLLTVDIKDDIGVLKEGGYRLCIAKKMIDSKGEICNVIWASIGDYMEITEFAWFPKYEVFATNSFQDKVKVTMKTNPVKMDLDEQIDYDAAGKFGQPKTGDVKGSLKINNKCQGVHFGVNQVTLNPKGVEISTPIYVSHSSSIKGTATYTPTEKVMVWFQADTQTSAMFEKFEGVPKEIDLTNYDSRTVQYEEGDWTII